MRKITDEVETRNFDSCPLCKNIEFVYAPRPYDSGHSSGSSDGIINGGSEFFRICKKCEIEFTIITKWKRNSDVITKKYEEIADSAIWG